MEDDIFPIEDSILPLQHGSVKEARWVFFFSFFPFFLFSFLKSSANACLRESAMADSLFTPLDRFLPGLKHMGEPVAGKVIVKWIEKLLRSIPVEVKNQEVTAVNPSGVKGYSLGVPGLGYLGSQVGGNVILGWIRKLLRLMD